MKVRSCTRPEELKQAFAILHDLRPHLTEESFHTLYEAARKADGYEIVGLYEGERCVAVMGYRVLHDFVHGKHLYIDDLVTDPALRSKGFGKRLLEFAEKESERLGCRGLRLCTGTQNEKGMRFYEREGWATRAVVYKKNFS